MSIFGWILRLFTQVWTDKIIATPEFPEEFNSISPKEVSITWLIKAVYYTRMILSPFNYWWITSILSLNDLFNKLRLFTFSMIIQIFYIRTNLEFTLGLKLLIFYSTDSPETILLNNPIDTIRLWRLLVWYFHLCFSYQNLL